MPQKNHKNCSPKAYYIRSSFPLEKIETTEFDKLNKYIKAVAPVLSFGLRQKFYGNVVRSNVVELKIPALNTDRINLTNYYFYVIVLNMGVFRFDIDEICYECNVTGSLTVTLTGTARQVNLSGVAKLLLLRFIKSETHKYYVESKN